MTAVRTEWSFNDFGPPPLKQRGAVPDCGRGCITSAPALARSAKGATQIGPVALVDRRPLQMRWNEEPRGANVGRIAAGGGIGDDQVVAVLTASVSSIMRRMAHQF